MNYIVYFYLKQFMVYKICLFYANWTHGPFNPFKLLLTVNTDTVNTKTAKLFLQFYWKLVFNVISQLKNCQLIK